MCVRENGNQSRMCSIALTFLAIVLILSSLIYSGQTRYNCRSLSGSQGNRSGRKNDAKRNGKRSAREDQCASNNHAARNAYRESMENNGNTRT